MHTFKIGDTVKVVDIHQHDAYYSNRRKFIGAIGIVRRLNLSDAPEGFLSGDLEIGEDTCCVYAVKLELVEAAKHPTHLICKRWFDGNTHFSFNSKLFFSDGTSEVLFNIRDGYGYQCIRDSVAVMRSQGYLPQPHTATFNEQALADAGISYEITDVARKADL